MTLPIPAAVPRTAVYEPLIRLLRDTLTTPRAVAERWRLSEDHLSNMRRRNHGLPWMRLPTGNQPNRGSVRYRLSDVIVAEILGTSGHITWSRLELFLAARDEIPEPQRLALLAKARAAFG